MKIIDSQPLPVSFKGEVTYKLVNNETGEVKEHTQPNLWLDQGIKNLYFVNTIRDPSVAMILSSSIAQPLITQTSIPDVITGAWSSRSYEGAYSRWRFQNTFSAPASLRTINTIGLAWNTNGTSAYCLTKLTEPLIQSTIETLYVYYYVYIYVSKDNGVITWRDEPIFKSVAFLSEGSCYFAYKERYATLSSYKPINVEYGLQYDSGGTLISYEFDPSANSSKYRFNHTYNPLGGLSTTVSHINGISCGPDSPSWRAPKVTSEYGYDLSMFPSYFKGKHVGRVWAKNKASNSIYFDSSSIDMYPQGYPFGFEFTVNYSGPSLPRNYCIITAYIVNGGYYITCEGTLNQILLNEAFKIGLIRGYRSFCNYSSKFSREISVFSYCQSNTIYETYTPFLPTIYDSKANGFRQFGQYNRPYYFLHDNCLPNNIFAMNMYNSYNTLVNFSGFPDQLKDWGTITETNITTPLNVRAGAVINTGTIEIPEPKVLLYGDGGELFTYDTATETFNTNTPDHLIGYNKKQHDNNHAYGFYDNDTDLCYLNRAEGLMVLDYNNNQNLCSIDPLDSKSFLNHDAWNFSEVYYDTSYYYAHYIKNYYVDLLNLKLDSLLKSETDIRSGHIVGSGPFSLEIDIPEALLYLDGIETGVFVESIDTPTSTKSIGIKSNSINIDMASEVIESFETDNIVMGTDIGDEFTGYIDAIGAKFYSSTAGVTGWGRSTEQASDGTYSLKTTEGTGNTNQYLEFTGLTYLELDYYFWASADNSNYYNSLYIYINDKLIKYEHPGYTHGAGWNKIIIGSLNTTDVVKIRHLNGTYGHSTLYKCFIDNIRVLKDPIVYQTNSIGIQIAEDLVSEFTDTGVTTARLKIERDGADLVTTSYSTDGGTTWNLYNTIDPYYLVGKAKVGIQTKTTSTYINKVQISIDEYIISGDINKNVVMIPSNDIFINSIRDVAYSSPYSTVTHHNNNKILRAAKDGIYFYDKSTLQHEKIDYITNRYRSNEVYGAAFNTNNIGGVIVHYYGSRRTTSRANKYEASLLGTCQVPNYELELDSETMEFKSISGYADDNFSMYTTDSNGSIRVAQKINSPISLNYISNSFELIGHTSNYNDTAASNKSTMGFKTLHWDSTLGKIVLADSHLPEEEYNPIPFNTDWQTISTQFLGDIQVRNNLNPSAPENTFNTADKYTCIINQDAFSKDNQQTMSAFEHLYYLCKTIERNEILYGTLKNRQITVIDDEDPAAFLTLDFGHSLVYEAKFTNSDGSPAYFTLEDLGDPVIVDTVTSPTVFTLDNLYVDRKYNFYANGYYLKFGTEYRKVTGWDGLNKIVTIETAFTANPIATDTVEFHFPADATATTTLGNETDNIFYVNELTGEVIVGDNDTGLDLHLTYFSLFRSW